MTRHNTNAQTFYATKKVTMHNQKTFQMKQNSQTAEC